MIKQVAKKIVYHPTFNLPLRSVVKLFVNLLPPKFVYRFPIVGTVTISLPHSKSLYLYINGLDIIASKVYWHNDIMAHEAATMPLFFDLLKQVDTMLDIGANVGIYTLIAAIDNPNRQVWAFEPAPTAFASLQCNVQINQLDNVNIQKAAATDYDGEITFYIPHVGIPVSGSTRQDFRQAVETISVPAISLDSFIHKNNLPRIDLVKIDTEGTEDKVFAGARNLLEKDRPLIICEVLEGIIEANIQAQLEHLDYKYFWISDAGLIEQSQIVGNSQQNMNYLFVPAEKVNATLFQCNSSV